MNWELIYDNFTNPALLFFFLGLVAVQLKSDLEIPASSSKFISLYLLFAIGFKGGQELSHSGGAWEIWGAIAFGVFLAVSVPLYTFFILKRRLGSEDAGAIAASYGSVSAVTFVTAISFLELQGVAYGGHMVAVMAIMEAPSIVVGVLLMRWFKENKGEDISIRKIMHHALTNGSVVLILGSLLIGFVVSDQQASGIKPFTTDIFKGFLVVFLLDMGIVSGRKIGVMFRNGGFVMFFSLLVPLLNGTLAAWFSQFITDSPGDRLLFSILAASASYIAVPAAMKIAAPKADPGLYIPMALGVTFPFNVCLGMPLYFLLVNETGGFQLSTVVHQFAGILQGGF